MKSIVDVERQPKPAFFAYREALTPLMANIRTDRWKFFSGEKMKCEFWVCNDTHEVPAKPTLAWELEVDGKIIHAQRATAKVKPIESVFQGFTAIPVPEVTQRTKGKLRLALFDGDKLVHDTAIDVEFFPKPKPLDLAVQIIGSKTNAVARLARELKLRAESGTGFQPVKPLTGKMPVPLFLIDDYAAYEKRRTEIDSAIQNGARAIFLNLPKGDYLLPGSSTKVTVQSANPHFLSRATGHPLVAGFEPFDFQFWFDEQANMLTPLATGKFTGDSWTTILKAQGVNGVAERKSGKGRVILCEVFLVDRVTANPTARMFAEKLLSP
jgi:hypothetical protein